MKFLIDAQLPRRLALAIQDAGYDAIHTLDLPDGSNTTDAQINTVSIDEERIVVSKDADFVNSFLLRQIPYKLLLISTGNITNKELHTLFMSHLQTIIDAFKNSNFVELNRAALVIHD